MIYINTGTLYNIIHTRVCMIIACGIRVYLMQAGISALLAVGLLLYFSILVLRF